MSKIKFWTEPRDGQLSLWVDAGFGPFNIWDIPTKQATPNVLNAVASAFERGMEMAVLSMNRLPKVGPISGICWKEKKVCE